jgi:hypothetical protein
MAQVSFTRRSGDTFAQIGIGARYWRRRFALPHVVLCDAR